MLGNNFMSLFYHLLLFLFVPCSCSEINSNVCQATVRGEGTASEGRDLGLIEEESRKGVKETVEAKKNADESSGFNGFKLWRYV